MLNIFMLKLACDTFKYLYNGRKKDLAWGIGVLKVIKVLQKLIE